jgi:Putative Actinobacterial Holin-X, holin superfamily III
MATGEDRNELRTGEERDELREQPMGDLFKQLSNDLSTLVRQELKLAQAEMTEKGKRAGIGVGMFGAAGIVGLLALGSLTACLVAALATGMEVWLAALIVTVVYGAVAGVLALIGKTRVTEATPPVPEQTVESVKEDVQWAKTQLPSGGK